MKRFRKEIPVRFEDIKVGEYYSRYDNGLTWLVEEKNDQDQVIKVRLHILGKKTDLQVSKKSDASLFQHKKKN